MAHYNLYFLATTLLFLLGLSFLQIKAQNFQDSLAIIKKDRSPQAATMPLTEKTLDELAHENTLLLAEQNRQNNKINTHKDTNISSNLRTFQKQNTTSKYTSSNKKQLQKSKKKNSSTNKKNLYKKHKNKNTRGGLHLNFKWIELDWFMVGLAIALFMGLMLLLYFLFVGNTLSLFEMILFAMGFGFALFSFIFLSSEADGGRAAYEFFVKYGIFSWAGIMAIIAGFAGLFGATGSFWSFILIGLIIGGISFVLSLLLGDHLFMGYEQRKRN